MSYQAQPSYEFGPFSVDVGRRLLLRDGRSVPLAPKVLETLLALIEHRERVVSKDELLRQVWGDTVVEEGGLARNISILRKALGERPDDHRYIVTVPACGYRFVAEVREARGNSGTAAVFVGQAHPMSESRRQQPGTVWRWLVLGGLAAIVVATTGSVLYPVPAIAPTRPLVTSLAVLPLDNLSGDPAQESTSRTE